jgi:DNA (cytosine-5)-methyltransferase 1
VRTNSLLSLFCGCGSFDYGFTAAGFRVALALDINRDAVTSYNCNRRTKIAEVCDLSEVSTRSIVDRCIGACGSGSFVGVIGGAPCQSFSHGNVHKRTDDARNALPSKFSAIARAMKTEFNIDFFVFENVTGLRSAKHEVVFTGFKDSLRRDFAISEAVLDAVDYGVPQRRQRIFVVGINKAKFSSRNFVFAPPKSGPAFTVRDAIGGLPAPLILERGDRSRASAYHPNHRAMAPRSPRLLNGSLREGDASSRSFRVLSWDKPSWTVAYGNREVHVHPSGKRRLSVYEAMLLQGFPKKYLLTGSLSSQIKQVSDAVPQQLGFAIAKQLMLQLGLR